MKYIRNNSGNLRKKAEPKINTWFLVVNEFWTPVEIYKKQLWKATKIAGPEKKYVILSCDEYWTPVETGAKTLEVV